MSQKRRTTEPSSNGNGELAAKVPRSVETSSGGGGGSGAEADLGMLAASNGDATTPRRARSASYERFLTTYSAFQKEEEAAEHLIPILGRLYKDKNVVTVIYHRRLNKLSHIAVMKVGNFVVRCWFIAATMWYHVTVCSCPPSLKAIIALAHPVPIVVCLFAVQVHKYVQETLKKSISLRDSLSIATAFDQLATVHAHNSQLDIGSTFDLLRETAPGLFGADGSSADDCMPVQMIACVR